MTVQICYEASCHPPDVAPHDQIAIFQSCDLRRAVLIELGNDCFDGGGSEQSVGTSDLRPKVHLAIVGARGGMFGRRRVGTSRREFGRCQNIVCFFPHPMEKNPLPCSAQEAQ